jgi:Ankyrin repeats (3 copies)/Ankyrin repeat
MGVAGNVKCDDQDYTALHIACVYGHTECVQALLSGDADVHAVCESGATPAFIAALQGYTECLELLLEHAADLTTCDNDGNTLLHAAAAGGRVQCMSLLLSYNSDSCSTSTVDAVTALGGSPLSLCAAPVLRLSVKSRQSSDKAACAQLLLEAGASVTPAVLAALVPAAATAAAAVQLNDSDSEGDDDSSDEEEQDEPAAGARIISDYIASLRSSRAADSSLLAIHTAACRGHLDSTGTVDQDTAESAADVPPRTDTVDLRLVHAVTGAAAAEYTLNIRTLERLLAITDQSAGDSASVLMNILRPPSGWHAPLQSSSIELKFDGEYTLIVPLIQSVLVLLSLQ